MAKSTIIGLTGPAGSGKSTLAKYMDEATKEIPGHFEYVPFPTLHSSKFNIVSALNFEERVEAQEEIFNNFVNFVTKLYGQKRNFILDRTPLDFLAYLLCEINMHSTPSHAEKVKRLYDDCFHFTNYMFKGIAYVPSFGLTEQREGKAPINSNYELHYEVVTKGLLQEDIFEVPLLQVIPTQLELRFAELFAFTKVL